MASMGLMSRVSSPDLLLMSGSVGVRDSVGGVHLHRETPLHEHEYMAYLYKITYITTFKCGWLS